MNVINVWFIFVLLFIFSCSHQEEFVYVDPTWEPEVLMEKANSYLQEQDYDHAFDAFSVIYEHYPTSMLYTDAALGMAYIYGKNEQYEQQMDLLLTLVNENEVPSKIPAIYNQIGEFYEKTSTVIRELNPEDTIDLGKAIEFYKRSAIYPLSKDSISQAESHYKIALIQFQLKQKEKGLNSLNTIIKKYKNNPWAIQAMNFLNTYETTGILPGTIIEETAPVLPELDGVEGEVESFEEKVEELPPLDDTPALPELDTTAVQ
ncbi:MAG: tetratricopeptide repeat protein, partial [Calditrichia bacterium]|nr:tetratricopeptide repeat protein [Calditrichia bacterium]